MIRDKGYSTHAHTRAHTRARTYCTHARSLPVQHIDGPKRGRGRQTKLLRPAQAIPFPFCLWNHSSPCRSRSSLLSMAYRLFSPSPAFLNWQASTPTHQRWLMLSTSPSPVQPSPVSPLGDLLHGRIGRPMSRPRWKYCRRPFFFYFSSVVRRPYRWHQGVRSYRLENGSSEAVASLPWPRPIYTGHLIRRVDVGWPPSYKSARLGRRRSSASLSSASSRSLLLSRSVGIRRIAQRSP